MLDEITVWLSALGRQFAVFDLQDSGCVSYGVRTAEGKRLFVKTSTTPTAAQSLRRALDLHAAVAHPAIVAPLSSVTFASGAMAIVYAWRDGQVLYPTTVHGSAIRTDPCGPMVAFRALPVARVLAAIDTILDVHLAVAAAGFVAVDCYDGCFLYDAVRHQMRLVDLDEYRPGPFMLTADRLPGSTRFMAPEESRRGAVIDERTTVFVLGRAMRLLLDAGDIEAAWRGTAAQLTVIAQATERDPVRRYPTVAALAAAWRAVPTPDADAPGDNAGGRATA